MALPALEGSDRTSVNAMCGNLTDQVRQHRSASRPRGARRPVAQITGSMSRRDSRAERHHLTRWSISSTPSASEVTRVAREVGHRGPLGGQAQVPGVAGTWKDLTDTSTRWRATSRHSPQYCRGRDPPIAAVICRRRSPSMSAARSCSSRRHHTMVDSSMPSAGRSDARRPARWDPTAGSAGKPTFSATPRKWKDLTET